MTEKRVFNVLVAEDESYQRLALLDILTLCDYEGTQIELKMFSYIAVAVENGQKAYDELQNNTNDFDLVLLDL